MDIVDWEKLWADFDEWHKGRHSNGTWEGQKAAIARLVEEQLRAKDLSAAISTRSTSAERL